MIKALAAGAMVLAAAASGCHPTGSSAAPPLTATTTLAEREGYLWVSVDQPVSQWSEQPAYREVRVTLTMRLRDGRVADVTIPAQRFDGSAENLAVRGPSLAHVTPYSRVTASAEVTGYEQAGTAIQWVKAPEVTVPVFANGQLGDPTVLRGSGGEGEGGEPSG